MKVKLILPNTELSLISESSAFPSADPPVKWNTVDCDIKEKSVQSDVSRNAVDSGVKGNSPYIRPQSPPLNHSPQKFCLTSESTGFLLTVLTWSVDSAGP